MRKRGERTLKELYDLTGTISEAEIIPFLKGDYRIQGPVDDLDLQLQRTDSGTFLDDKKKLEFLTDYFEMKIESGTCNVCSAPCSSCMHYNQSLSIIGSNSEKAFTGNIHSRGEADCSSVIVHGMPLYKRRICDNYQHATVETSYLVSLSSSHDSYSENAESKTTLRASVYYDASDDVDMSQVLSSGEVVEGEQLMKNSNQDHSISQSHVSTCLGNRVLLGTCEEHSGLECHGENIVCTVGASDTNIEDGNLILDLDKKELACMVRSSGNIAKLNDVALSAEADDGSEDHETEESNCASMRSTKIVDAPLLNNTYKSEPPLGENHTSPKTCILSSYSSRGSLSLKSNSEDIEGPLNLQTQADVIRSTEVEIVESSLASLAAGSSPQHQFNDLDSSRGSETKHGFSSGKAHIDDSNQEIRISTGSEIISDNGSRGNDANDPLERDDTLLDASKGQGLQTATDGENSEFDVLLDDVKVCDICGDAGREDLLAICNRCSDGAEHTYCMRKMLQKVPEGDWLCEECKIKEIENKNLEQCDTISGSLEVTSSDDVSQKSMITSAPNKLTKLDARMSNLDVGGSGKGLLCPRVLDGRQADHLDDGKASELSCASLDKDSPRKKLLLSRQVSLKNQDEGKLKMPDRKVSFEGRPEKGSQLLHRSKTSINSSSFKGQSQLHSPHGHFSRFMSFNNSNTSPKVKILIENDHHKHSISKESTKIDIRKEGMVKSMSKSTSFKSTGSGWLNNEPSIKAQSLPRNHDTSGLNELKERKDGEKKNFCAIRNSFFLPSASIATNYPTKKDGKSSQNDVKLNCILDPTVLLNKESNDADDIGCNEGKKHLSYSSRSFGVSNGKNSADNPRQNKVPKEVIQTSIAVDGSSGKDEITSQHDVAKPLDSSQKDNKMSDSAMLISSRMFTSGGSKTLFCRSCNEIGHATQNCSINKVRISSRKPLAERSSRELMKKGNKWQDPVDETISRSRVLKGGKPDTLEELPVGTTGMVCKMPPKSTSDIFSQWNFSSVIECNNCEDSSKELDADPEKVLAPADFEHPSVHPVEFSDTLKSNSSIDVATINELDVKPLAENLPAVDPLSAKPFRASAIPKLECIWSGSLNILVTGSPPEIFDGIQAHLSSSASDRAFEVANKARSSIQLEEVTHKSSSPSQFQRFGPQDRNIALFFFAKDIESYDKSYSKLMDKLCKNDLALRGNIDGTELLIFTSDKLPENSQRWNGMFYLWGIFRTKTTSNLPSIDYNKKPRLSTLDIEVKNEELSVLPMNDVPNAQSSETSAGLKKSSECNKSAKIDPEQSFTAVDLGLKAPDIEDKVNKAPEASIVHNFVNQLAADPKIPSEHPSFSLRNLSRTLPDLLSIANTPESRFQISASNVCSEVKNDGSCQKKICDLDRKTGESLALPDDNIIQSGHRRASSVPLVSANCNQECRRIEGEMGDREILPTSEANFDDDPRQDALSADHLISVSRKNRKRGRSCSTERITQPSGEIFSKPIDTIICRESASSIPVEDEREQKKTHFPFGFSIMDDTVSSQLSQKQLESLTTAERCFFPIEEDPIRSNRSANLIRISSSDNDDNLESCNPDLELVLGGKGKSTLPFIYQSTDRGKQQPSPGPSGEDDGNDASSLSLSLGFPALERERSSNRIAKSEQILPDRTPAGKSLFLFGRFRDC